MHGQDALVPAIPELSGTFAMAAQFERGDCVIYRKQKISVRPGPHARDIHPAPHGDSYSYEVDKFWTVIAVQSDGQITVRTRRGKQLTLNAGDPALRRANWLERLIFRRRFPPLETVDSKEPGAASSSVAAVKKQ
jgi:hypothetical protein